VEDVRFIIGFRINILNNKDKDLIEMIYRGMSNLTVTKLGK